MKGGGYYSLHTEGAKHVIDNTAELALAALSEIDLASAGSPFQLADFGAADGGTSIDLVRKVVAEVKRRAPAREVCVTYTDLPRNDYSALFTMLAGQRPDVKSYLQEHDGVFAYAAGTSFYQPIFATRQLDFGFSATAMHWLSRLPGPITGHIHAVGARGGELDAFRAHAMQDWETILLERARELRPGGRLVMSNFCMDDEGRYLGQTGGAPLTDESNPVYRAGLRLVSAETRIVPCPYAARFAEDGDADAFAVAYVPTLRSWSETVFFSGLNDSRPVEERRALVEQFYQSYIDRVRRDPEGHAMDYVHIYMVAEKV
jgi:hypothetical protein